MLAELTTYAAYAHPGLWDGYGPWEGGGPGWWLIFPILFWWLVLSAVGYLSGSADLRHCQ
jgi:putative membrane protein